VTGTVLVPKGRDPAGVPLIALSPGTHGAAARCAPSRMIGGGAFYEQPAVDEMVRAGYAVMVTDYEGYHPEPRTSYVAGRAMGHAVIDGVRAAQRLPEAGLPADAPVVFRGYSQGGAAAMWAGQLQPQYAPELRLAAVVGGGVPADLVQVSLPLEGSAGFGLLAYSLLGLDNAYPELDLGSSLNERGRTVFEAMARHDCTLELLLDYQGMRVQDLTERSPLLDPAWQARLAENKLGGAPIGVPVLQYHGTQDELVAFPQARALQQTYCDLGVDLTWRTQDRGHIAMVHHGSADAMEFIAARLAGEPAGSTCQTDRPSRETQRPQKEQQP
jgi:pimeloyl-ACP methyl ester carboxylesterase